MASLSQANFPPSDNLGNVFGFIGCKGFFLILLSPPSTNFDEPELQPQNFIRIEINKKLLSGGNLGGSRLVFISTSFVNGKNKSKYFNNES